MRVSLTFVAEGTVQNQVGIKEKSRPDVIGTAFLFLGGSKPGFNEPRAPVSR